MIKMKLYSNGTDIRFQADEHPSVFVQNDEGRTIIIVCLTEERGIRYFPDTKVLQYIIDGEVVDQHDKILNEWPDEATITEADFQETENWLKDN